MLKTQQYLILTLVMGLMLLQATPSLARRSRSSKSSKSYYSHSYSNGGNGNGDNGNGGNGGNDGNGGNGNGGDGNGDGNGGMAPVGTQTTVGINVVDLTNFLVQGFFDFLIGILASIGLCIPQCATADLCLGCFVISLPPPPVVPASVIDPGNAQIIG